MAIKTRVVSWDGHALNDTNYETIMMVSTGLPSLEPQYADRFHAASIITGIKFNTSQVSPIQIAIINSANEEALRLQLHQWFDNKSGVPKQLVIENWDGNDQRYIEGVCIGMVQTGGAGGIGYTAVIALDGLNDPHYRLRSVTPATDTWNITASGQTKVVTNAGQDEAYPIVSITPTGAKSSGGYAHKRWVPVVWRSSQAEANYHIEITNGGLNTAALVTAGKMKSSADDVRVEVNGSEVPRHFNAFNTSSTKIWTAMNFSAAKSAVLLSSMGTGAITDIVCSSSISSFPESGILLIGNEGFSYSGKLNDVQTFKGVTRALNSTTAASHTAGSTIYWIENEVWLKYNNPGSSAYIVNDATMPIFKMDTSTNASRAYLRFYDPSYLSNPGNWTRSLGYITFQDQIYDFGHPSSSTENAIGLSRGKYAITAVGNASMTNPCGITRFQVSGKTYWKGEPNLTNLDNCQFVGAEKSTGVRTEHTIVNGTEDVYWTNWSADLTGLTDVNKVYMELRPNLTGPAYGLIEFYMELPTLTLDSTKTPLVTLGAEVSNYTMAGTLTNQTTGDVLVIALSMALNETLQINTNTGEVLSLLDGSSRFSSVSRPDSTNPFWFSLLVGANTLKFDDVGTTAVTIGLSYEKRYYY
jgi:hypothetical protein